MTKLKRVRPNLGEKLRQRMEYHQAMEDEALKDNGRCNCTNCRLSRMEQLLEDVAIKVGAGVMGEMYAEEGK